MIKENLRDNELHDQIAIITGGGSGIGRSTALLMAEKGYKIVIVGRRLYNLEKVQAEVEQGGAEILVIQEDINNYQAGNKIVKKTMDRFARIDILINNAGVPGEGVLLHNLDDKLWNEILNTNLTAAFRLIKAVMPIFMTQKTGHIINISSLAAHLAMAKMGAYASSKAGLLALTRSIALDYQSYGIRCNSICPGTIITEMTKSVLKNLYHFNDFDKFEAIPNIGRAVDIAKVITFLCSPDASFINGASIILDGGQGKI